MSAKSKIDYLLNIINSSSKSSSVNTSELFTNESDMVSSLSNPESSWNPHESTIIDNTRYTSITTELQEDTETAVLDQLANVPELKFNKSAHLKYTIKALKKSLPAAYISLDANHTWMVYWLYNSYVMLTDDPFDKDLFPLIVNKVEECLIDNGRGGIAGGSNQLGHVASSYSGILTLVITKQYELLDQIRFNFYEWLMKLKLPNGSFMMHEDGESDTRSTYCVLVIANLLNIATDELLEGVEDWIDLCQTYEGGFSNIPNTEAHGGYTFCAVASYFLLHSKIPGKDSNKFGFSLDFLTRWCVQRQHELEGGFDGRTNKLVDACYSFWVGALFPMVELLAGTSQSLFDREGLRHYILRVAQEETGGFRDKPGKGIDFYHTNYTLSGLSIVEHSYEINDTDTDEPVAFKITSSESDNLFTKAIHPIFGIPIEYVNDCRQYFASKNNKK